MLDFCSMCSNCTDEKIYPVYKNSTVGVLIGANKELLKLFDGNLPDNVEVDFTVRCKTKQVTEEMVTNCSLFSRMLLANKKVMFIDSDAHLQLELNKVFEFEDFQKRKVGNILFCCLPDILPDESNVISFIKEVMK